MKPKPHLVQELETTRAQLAEAQETLRAIREGEVDAVVVSGPKGEQIFALVGAESVYRLIVETMNEAAFTVTFGGKILYCNGQFGELIQRPAAKIVGHPLREFVLAEDQIAARSLLVEAQGRPVKQRLVFRNSNGAIVPTRVTASRINQPDEPCICIVAADLSELEQSTAMLEALRQSQEALRLEEERSRLIFENSVIAMTIADTEGRVFRANPAFLKMLGYSSEELKAIPYGIYTHPEDLARELPLVEELLAGKRSHYNVEKRFIRKDGGTLWASLVGTVVRDAAGKPLFGITMIQDISERKRAEEAHIESEARMRAIISTFPIGVAVVDSAGSTVLANEMMEKIWAGAQEHVVFASSIADTGRFLGWWASSGTELAAEDRASSRALRQGETSLGEVIDIERMDGKRGTILNNASPLRDGKGNVNGAAIAVMDITELTQAQKALKDADRRKDEFLAMLAHELRNPLAAIRSAIEVLKIPGATDQMLEHARDAATRQSNQMAQLLDDLLDAARVTQGKILLDKQQISVVSVLESAVEASNPFINARKHRLYVSHPGEPMHVNGDPVRLSQAVGNLLHNAAKFTPREGEIYLVLERKGDEALILVRDNGRGIEPELLPQVFDLFVQGSRTPDRAEGGLGIGLTLVRSLVELHNGRVEVHSNGPGCGSEFRIWLPLLPTVQRATGSAVSGEPESSRPLRLLVVDDNSDSAELLSFLLQSAGYEVIVATSALAALKLAKQHVPEIALVDIGMPSMDGYELARRIRSCPELRNVRLVAVTGYGQQEDIKKSRNAGFCEHLIKPLDSELVMKVLRSLSK
jgi:PAS domain S-box-containing protein